MTDIKHTTRPWRYDVESESVFADDGDVCPNVVFLNDNANGDQNFADGTLIAAAPDLLETVKLFERSLVYLIKVDRKIGDDEAAGMKTVTLNAVSALIAKAEGRS